MFAATTQQVVPNHNIHIDTLDDEVDGQPYFSLHDSNARVVKASSNTTYNQFIAELKSYKDTDIFLTSSVYFAQFQNSFSDNTTPAKTIGIVVTKEKIDDTLQPNEKYLFFGNAYRIVFLLLTKQVNIDQTVKLMHFFDDDTPSPDFEEHFAKAKLTSLEMNIESQTVRAAPISVTEKMMREGLSVGSLRKLAKQVPSE